MAATIQLLITLGAVIFPFVAMVWMWRRMKRVRATTYREAERPRSETPWQEGIEDRDGMKLARDFRRNDDLIALGDRERHLRWPVDPN